MKRASVRMPLAMESPNGVTRMAMAELEAGKGRRCVTVEALMDDLHASD
jgi:DNA-damage-inducible protein J